MTNTKQKRRKKDPNVYPAGWNYQRVKAIADYYDARKDQDLLGDVETTRTTGDLVWMEVPQQLVPQVRKLIARAKKTA